MNYDISVADDENLYFYGIMANGTTYPLYNQTNTLKQRSVYAAHHLAARYSSNSIYVGASDTSGMFILTGQLLSDNGCDINVWLLLFI